MNARHLRTTDSSALVQLGKLEDFAAQHRFETKAGLVLMSFLQGDCEHLGSPCELCGFETLDIELHPGEGYQP